jgi:O-methyltransferase
MEHPSYLSLLKRCLTASIYEESAWKLVEGPMPHERGPVALVKRLALSMLRKRGLRLVRTEELNLEARNQGLDWPLFGLTMAGTARLDNLQSCIETCLRENIGGDFVETGVWRGGSCILAKAIFNQYGASDRIVWCCDSFQGMPKPSTTDLSLSPQSDFSDRDYLVASVERVSANFRAFDLLDGNVRFIKGWFRNTLPQAPIERIAVLRTDGDLYESTMDALKYLYDKVSPGGFVIIDDYKSWAGCRTATDEFRYNNRIDTPLVDIDAHAVFWRKPS